LSSAGLLSGRDAWRDRYRLVGRDILGGGRLIRLRLLLWILVGLGTGFGHILLLDLRACRI
jgi:hypothetical protein